MLNPGQAAPADLRRTALAALAALPGLELRRGLADAEGRPAIGLRYAGLQTTLLDPETLQYLGMQDDATEIGPKNRTASFVSTIEEVAVVEQLGERP